jgi:hypothetical protein
MQADWERQCLDHGPTGRVDSDFTGYHHICCLNNMIPLRADVHALFDENEIGIDTHVCFDMHLLKSCSFQSLPVGQ